MTGQVIKASKNMTQIYILLELKMEYTKVSLFETHRIVIRESGHRFL